MASGSATFRTLSLQRPGLVHDEGDVLVASSVRPPTRAPTRAGGEGASLNIRVGTRLTRTKPISPDTPRNRSISGPYRPVMTPRSQPSASASSFLIGVLAGACAGFLPVRMRCASVCVCACPCACACTVHAHVDGELPPP